MNESNAIRFGEELVIAAWRLRPVERRHFIVDSYYLIDTMEQAARYGNPWAQSWLNEYPWAREHDVSEAFSMLMFMGLGWWRPPSYRAFTLDFSARMFEKLVDDRGEDLDARSVMRSYLVRMGHRVVA